jgi:hypothetical protein
MVQIREGIFIAVIEIASQGINDDGDYEVDKLRSKRLRIFEKESEKVNEFDLKTDEDDEWVKRLQTVVQFLVSNRSKLISKGTS